jgi:hypothetical protein
MGLDKHGWEPTLEVEELVFLLEFRNASTNFDQVLATTTLSPHP